MPCRVDGSPGMLRQDGASRLLPGDDKSGEPRMTDDLNDRLTIRQLVEDWAVLRDARLWDRFREVWHEDGVMQATWFQGTRDEFIKVSEEGYRKAVRILHFLVASVIHSSPNRS